MSVCDDSDGRGFHAAAIREAHEEAGIDLTEATLHHFGALASSGRASKTIFDPIFLAAAPGDLDVAIDHGEITEHHWMTPAEASVAALGRER